MSDILESEDVRMLVDIGFMALTAGLDGPAATIFKGVIAARPAQEAGPLGLAMVQLARSEVNDAIVTLRALPPSDAALTYLGIALARRGDVTEAIRILDDVAATASDEAFRDLAGETSKELRR